MLTELRNPGCHLLAGNRAGITLRNCFDSLLPVPLPYRSQLLASLKEGLHSSVLSVPICILPVWRLVPGLQVGAALQPDYCLHPPA